MTLKIILFSQEVEDFVLEIKIDADASFRELHRLILESCGYSEGDGHGFLICDEDWRVSHKILLHDSGKMGSDEDLYLMDRSTLGDFLDDEGQRFAYVFDGAGHRLFLMELSEVLFGKPQPQPIVSRRHGKAPAQYLETAQEECPAIVSPSVEMEEDAGLEEDFDETELDLEGLEIKVE